MTISARAHRGATGHRAGLAAEAAVAAHYGRSGRAIVARRWRGAGGEIDLIAREPGRVVFIEVKKSGNFARALERLGGRQARRIRAAAAEFLAGEAAGLDTEARFDVALVDGMGRVEIVENALC
ncbi:hypothetical protein C2I36_02075 [Rhodobacteraceae bacterium WD3A24]|nr:hypothetical protein C2I36_02075 [Rhodobacteraceae bacterium WD3A24]